MREIADFFKALGDETRLQILYLLLHHGELCVCDIEQVLHATQSKTSRHLRYLLNAGLVRDRRQGVWVHYRLDDGAAPQALAGLLRQMLTGPRAAQIEQNFQSWKTAREACCPTPVGAGAAARQTHSSHFSTKETP
jgi:ArsR family transcriptional regulator, arsenate/arsenite/antimonite-responsive transcriptional repressor